MPIKECRVTNNIHKIAEPFCIEARKVDGNDVLEVYEVAKKAVQKCRDGNGPVFLVEFITYRFRGHVGPDDNIQGTHTDIRPKEEIAYWLEKDPIKKLECYLMENNLMDESELNEIKEEIHGEVNNAHVFAKSSPSPDGRELTKYVYK